MGKQVSGKFFKVLSVDGNSGLGHTYKTYNEALEAICDSQEYQKKAGYEPERWLIVRVTWERKWDKNGRFEGETTKLETLAEVNENNQVEQWRL